jgi:dipeptidyl-peptidase-4
MRLVVWLLVAGGMAVVSPLPAAAQDSPEQTAALLRRLFTPGDFSTKGFGPARWMEGGASYTTVEPAAGQSDVLEIIRYTTASGERTVLVSAAQLTPKGGKPLVLEDFEWSADGRRLLIFTNSKPVWRDNTRGDSWVLDRTSGVLRKLGGTAPESSLLFAKFSPDGTRVGYVRGNNIYVEDIATGKITQITRDGSDIIVNGTSDWVYEEELFLRDCFRWSPDGKKIAYWQFDTSGASNFPLVYYTGKPREIATGMPYPGIGTYPIIQNFPYPLAGTTNSAVRIGVISARGGKTTWVQVPGDPRQNYLARMEWAENSTELILQQLNRKQNQAGVWIAQAASGAVRRIHLDQEETFLDYNTELRALDGGKEYLWISESSGWRHVYRIARDGSGASPVTRGDWEIDSVPRVDEKGGWLYFSASPENSTQRYLYRTRLDGAGAPERLTPTTQPGWHSYQVSPDGRWAFHTHMTFGRPPRIDLVALPEHRSIRLLQENATARKNIEALGLPPVEFFQVPVGDGVICDAWMQRPANFDPAKKYPLLVYVYGEPWHQTVTEAWEGGNGKFHMAVARAGYIVASVDTRGTPALKGRAWRKVIYGAVGPLSSKEHAAAVREMLRTRPYLDAARVAVWGWSGGGTSTLNLMFRSPDVYQAGMSVAPVPDQRLYDTIYQERYMGLPQENVEGYRSSAPINFAEGLQGKLLIAHGTGDDNVHIQGTELLVNRLIELGKSFDYFAYPNRTHAISEGQGTTLHLFSLLMRFLRSNLPAGASGQ